MLGNCPGCVAALFMHIVADQATSIIGGGMSVKMMWRGVRAAAFGVYTPWHAFPLCFYLRRMKTDCRNQALTLGEFIECMYNTCDAHQARLLVWLAVQAQLVVFKEESAHHGIA